MDEWRLSPGVKIVASILLGYGHATIHHLLFSNLKPHLQYLHFILTSFLLFYWNFGLDLYHPILSIVFQWLLFKLFKGSRFCLTLSFIFQMGYYIVGCLFSQTKEYDVNWLTPQCVLALRMIGLAFDVYDGQRNQKDLTADQRERSLTDPGLFEMIGFSFFPGGFLIGPQYPLVRMRKLVKGELVDDDVVFNSRYIAAFKELLLGSVVLGFQQYFSTFYNYQFYTTNQFQEYSLISKIIYIAISGNLFVLQYLSIWTINNGVCIISGLGYIKDPISKEVKWNAVQNAFLDKFFTSTRFQHLISCHNVNTNGWVLRYIHRRLRFVGVKAFSHFCSLFFLALWHGLHVGYFTVFLFQFLVINAEKSFVEILSKFHFCQRLLSDPILTWIPSTIGFIYLHLFLGYAIIDFSLLQWNVYKPVFDSVFWHGHIFFLLMFLFSKLYTIIRPQVKLD